MPIESLLTLVSILAALFVGFLIAVPKPYLSWINALLTSLIYFILLLIGMTLAGIEDLGQQLDTIMGQAILLALCVIGSGLLALMAYDHLSPWQHRTDTQQVSQSVSIHGSLLQVGSVLIGYAVGWLLSWHQGTTFLLPEWLTNAALLLLILLVGISLRGVDMRLRDVLLHKRGLQTSVVFIISVWVGGAVFALLVDEPISKGLALASGFGWYSLSGFVMTDAYDGVWGSIALINDLLREFVALVCIPIVMRRYPSAAVGLGGATSLDFTLPIIQQSGGIHAAALAISYGMLVNIVSPIAMLVFSSF